MTADQTHFPRGGLTVEGKEEGDALPSALRRALEKVLSSDLSSVRLRRSPDLEGLGALACMQGEDIYLSPSAPALDTPAGVAVLGHELAHVLQQRAGRVIAEAGNPIVEDKALEAEADRVGLHCAAQLFPGVFNDPGMPQAARRSERRASASLLAPIQFLIPSRDSFDDFITAAWNYLNIPLVNQMSAAHVLNHLYDEAATYNPNHVAPKNPLAGVGLYGQMAAYIQATNGHTIRMQSDNHWPNITAQVANFAAYYTNKSNGVIVPVNQTAEQLKTRYLHIYPNAQAPADWRIGLNVLPADMAAAMTALEPLLNQYASIGHMKFLSPGDASKADSVIVYCEHGGNDYPQLEQAVLAAAVGLNTQHRVGAMWDEIAPGIGLASEPPMDGTSFTEYRCMITYLTYMEYMAGLGDDDDPDFGDFNDWIDDAMAMFGIDVNSPHEQGPVQVGNPNYPTWQGALDYLRTLW